MSARVRATFSLEPNHAASSLALQLSTGMDAGPEWARARVSAVDGDRVVVEINPAIWGHDVTTLMSALVAGEAMERKDYTRCRLVDLELPEGWLPGPAFGSAALTRADAEIGVIVKPAVGLGPSEVAAVVAQAVAGGASFVKDDEVMGDPPWCRLADRVRAVGAVLEPSTTYCANVTGPSATLVDRARQAVDLGAGAVMVAALAQGLSGLAALRQAELGVPIFAHRAGSGPSARNDRFGATGAVLARLLRLVGADYVIAGAFDGKLFETNEEVAANLDAITGHCGSVLPSVAVMGGGLGPGDVANQVARAGRSGLLLLLGSAAYSHAGGLQEAVRQGVSSLSRATGSGGVAG